MKTSKIILGAIGVCLLMLCAIALGNSVIPFGETLGVLGEKILGLSLDSVIDSKHATIIWQIRLPRVLLAFLVGGSLAASGSVVQSILQNELASPYTLGVSAGASLGVGLTIVFGWQFGALGRLSLPMIGFVGGMATVYLVIHFSKLVDPTLSNNTIILAGMVFSLFVNSILTILSAMFNNSIEAITLWQMGSFAMKGWSYVQCIIPFCLVGMVGVLYYTREMDLLTFGEEQAKAIGVETERVKNRLFILASILTGAAVAVGGVIGFIDLIAPHVVRRYFGSKHCYVVPMSFVFGGILMVITDLVARTIISQSELPVGAITSIIGAPFFAYVYFKKRRGK